MQKNTRFFSHIMSNPTFFMRWRFRINYVWRSSPTPPLNLLHLKHVLHWYTCLLSNDFWWKWHCRTLWTSTMSLNRRNKCEIVTHSQTNAFTRLVCIHVVILICSLVSTMEKFKLFPIPATSLGLKFPNFHTTEAIALDTNAKETRKRKMLI